MFIIRAERARHAKVQANKAANTKRSKSSNGTAGFSRQKKNATMKKQGSILSKTGGDGKKKELNSKSVNKQSRKDSFALNGILEDPLENASTQDNDMPDNNARTTNLGQKGKDGKTGKSALTAHKTPKKPISKLRYVKDIGLIVTAFNGTIKFFDAFNFYQIWKNDNKSRSEN